MDVPVLCDVHDLNMAGKEGAKQGSALGSNVPTEASDDSFWEEDTLDGQMTALVSGKPNHPIPKLKVHLNLVRSPDYHRTQYLSNLGIWTTNRAQALSSASSIRSLRSGFAARTIEASQTETRGPGLENGAGAEGATTQEIDVRPGQNAGEGITPPVVPTGVDGEPQQRSVSGRDEAETMREGALEAGTTEKEEEARRTCDDSLELLASLSPPQTVTPSTGLVDDDPVSAEGKGRLRGGSFDDRPTEPALPETSEHGKVAAEGGAGGDGGEGDGLADGEVQLSGSPANLRLKLPTGAGLGAGAGVGVGVNAQVKHSLQGAHFPSPRSVNPPRRDVRRAYLSNLGMKGAVVAGPGGTRTPPPLLRRTWSE
ncbi:unnamed protein product, partial [Discosporangium mesarthrocarpum]